MITMGRTVQCVYRLMITLLLLVALSGCLLEELAPDLEDTDPEGSGERHRVVTVELDITGSYADSLPHAKAALARELQRALPGDIWHFRLITRRSHSDRAAIPGLERVEFDSVPEATNPFSRKSKLARRGALRQHEQTQQRVVKLLESYRPQFVRGTDVYGALSKAGRLLGSYPDRRKFLILATNFGETERLGACTDLQGVAVYVLFQGGPDPAEVRRRKEKWQRQLASFGAVGVTFLDRANWSAGIIEPGGEEQ